MTDALLSRFETYLFDEELELESNDEDLQLDYQNELSTQEVFPPGFFTSL